LLPVSHSRVVEPEDPDSRIGVFWRLPRVHDPDIRG
jgi:hypothetical protein